MQRALAPLSWLGVALADDLHIAFWRGLPLDGWALTTLTGTFLVAAGALLGLILTVQRHAGELAYGYFEVVPRVGRIALGLGFLLVVANLIDWMPIAGAWRGSGADPAAFERAFSAILAWQTMAAALYHTYVPTEPSPT